MNKKHIIIDGNNFSDLEGFYSTIDEIMTKNLDWKTGHNLDAFNDLLWGGFGVHDYEEPIRLTWINSIKSERDLGWESTINYLKSKLKTCHPTNRDIVADDLKNAENKEGITIFDILIEIIKKHEHVEFYRE